MFLDYDPDDLDVQVAELLVATSDGADPELPPQICEVLRKLRERLGMDVAFVSRIDQGRRTFKAVDSRPGLAVMQAGMSDPVEATWCQRVMDGRLPEVMADAAAFVAAGQAPKPRIPIGTHLSTPVPLPDGSVYGTLCCFSQPPAHSPSEADIKRLQYAAGLLGTKIQPRPAPTLQPL